MKGEGWGREAEETAGPVRASLLLVELEVVPLWGVVAFSNLVESPTVENEEGSCKGRCQKKASWKEALTH